MQRLYEISQAQEGMKACVKPDIRSALFSVQVRNRQFRSRVRLLVEEEGGGGGRETRCRVGIGTGVGSVWSVGRQDDLVPPRKRE